nr:MAG TPA: hypothetical protein [Caudoviricetes sp.]
MEVSVREGLFRVLSFWVSFWSKKVLLLRLLLYAFSPFCPIQGKLSYYLCIEQKQITECFSLSFIDF